ncbi:hypothetical protein [Endozoicomonas sp.]|uniref:hypothetical protein n=1 Tax=Endozoicomonas sp. TaxID=1892382 RepID=UPI00383A3704
MVSRRFSQPQKQFIARRFILLVCMVLAVCLWQRAGFGSTCPLKADHFTSGFFFSSEANHPDHQQDASESTDTECELSNHLIQAKSQLIEPGILLIPLLLLILAWLCAGNRTTFPSLTEPIIPRRRHHLVLCVFRE